MSDTRIAVVTGASRGIGEATAVELARRGNDVALVARDQTALARISIAIESLGRQALAITGDLHDLEFAENVIKQTVDRFAQNDVLVNNAAWRELVTMRHILLESWELTLRICLTTSAFMARWAAPSMEQRHRGVIINVASMMSRQTGRV